MSIQPIYFPNELWFFILKQAVASGEWRSNVYFPPADDFTLIDGFKGACKAFCTLVVALRETLRDRSIHVADAGKILRNSSLPLDRVRHIMIERNTTLADYLLFMPRCEKLVSLSLSFAQREFAFLGLQTFLVSQNLVRLDLTYEDVFWRALTLDFPNLLELRLSSEKPLKRREDPTYIPTMCVGGDRFAADLINSLRKLQRLKYLSLHISLDDQDPINAIRYNHLDRHKCADIVHFTRCKFCIRSYSNADIVRAREAKLSQMLAAKLPALERVLWTDAWNESFYDEEAQRESKIVRCASGKISVRVDGKKVAMLKKFTMTGA